jgi:hypothetical protein
MADAGIIPALAMNRQHSHAVTHRFLRGKGRRNVRRRRYQLSGTIVRQAEVPRADRAPRRFAMPHAKRP